MKELFLESSKRNPVLAGLMPTVRNYLKGLNGKAKQQLALAKLSTGTTMMMEFGMYAYGAHSSSVDFMITGIPPSPFLLYTYPSPRD